MKKTRLFALVALALISAACAKENEAPMDPQGDESPNGVKTIVFTAQAPTKTSIDANDKVVNWVAGDEVKFVWDGGSTTSTAASDGASTTFSIVAPEGVQEIYAVYPSSAAGSYESGNVTISFNGSCADGSFSSNGICVAKATKNGENWSTSLAFQNVACLIKVGVSSNDLVKVRVQAEGGEAICGDLPLSINGSGDIVLGTITNPGSTVSVPVSGPGNYYIPVIPGVTMASGFRVARFIGSSDQITPFFYNGSYTTAKGKIIKLDDIDAHSGHYYVTPNGAGTKAGQSWNNAMDAAGFKAFVENQENYFILTNATFHFSAEEFSFGDDYVQPAYPDHANVVFTLEGTVTPTDTTTFLGRDNTGDSNKAGILWPQQNSYITIKNVKFTGVNGASNSAAIRINNSAKSLTLDHCYFRGNSTVGQGAAIALFNSCTLTIRDCSFSDNHGTGAALIVNNSAASVRIQDTEFVGNYSDAMGGAIYIAAIKSFDVSGGKFEGNYANGAHDTNAAGAAIYASGANVVVNCTDVLFKKNHNYVGTNEKSGGILRIEQEGGAGHFNRCIFDGNYTNRENSKNPPCAAIVNCRKGDVKYYFNACEFKENTSGTGNSTGVFGGLRGTVFATLAGSTFAFNNCSFHDNYGGRNTDDITWIGMDNTSSTLILANTTIAGDNYRAPGTGGARRNNWGVIKFQNTGNFYLLNSILCSLDTSGNCFWVNGDLMLDGATKIKDGGPKLPVYCYYCKTSKEGDGWTDWGTDTGSGHNYYATSASFGGWSMPYTWNGTLTGANSSMLAATADVNIEIQSADADFYAWLNSIGALGKDIAGHDRGATSWPGCYQN